MRVAVETQVGDAAQAEVYMERLIDVMKTTAPGAIVEEAAQAVLSSPSCTPRLALLRFGQALISVHRNDAKSAERDYSYLLAFSKVMHEGEPI